MRIDLNADLGESFGTWRLGDDEAMLDFVSSANVACGFHAGDAQTMRRTVRQAAARGVSVGAHVGYRDLAGFGRREMAYTPEEISDEAVYQFGALSAICLSEGTAMRHVKPHGALYHRCCLDADAAEALALAVAGFDPALVVVGPDGSALLDEARIAGLRTLTEGFADRRYSADGALVPRGVGGAIIDDVEAVAAQAVAIATGSPITAVDGTPLVVTAETICLHGDTPDAVAHARAVRQALERAGVAVAAPDR